MILSPQVGPIKLSMRLGVIGVAAIYPNNPSAVDLPRENSTKRGPNLYSTYVVF